MDNVIPIVCKDVLLVVYRVYVLNLKAVHEEMVDDLNCTLAEELLVLFNNIYII